MCALEMIHLLASHGNEEKIDVGDVVRFKGGGSSMTVEKIEGNEAICVFSLGGKQRLKLEALEKVQDEPYWWSRG